MQEFLVLKLTAKASGQHHNCFAADVRTYADYKKMCALEVFTLPLHVFLGRFGFVCTSTRGLDRNFSSGLPRQC